jgi:hypothetical protein
MSIASIVALVVAFALFGGVVAWLAREAARDRLKQRLRPPKPMARREPGVRGVNHSGRSRPAT